ncbi:dTDP-glucose 4,6-dehydratase [bacterium (Candidatus Howlettbacteria) CG_4_10_14_0_8_um_filter_40_9]|nr:MAG: dTDP-glucose 4,6-dehydratase [bacterium (Candidatus Howlettbacteria) CG_4_10_14_0_8_um_filter_40_9]
MKIFVTGGAGFIGANFIHYMLGKHDDIEIINFDSLTYAGNLENLKGIEADERYKFVKGDVCDLTHVTEAMKGADIAVHFAAESHVDRSILEPAEFIKTNVLGTHNLLMAALKNKIKRFHHISTDEVFGSLELGTKDMFNEETPYNPHSPYSASKASSDHLVRAYGDTFGLPFTITNCSNNYGPFQFPEKIIPLFLVNAFMDKPLPLYGDGKSTRDYLYVEDHCEAIDLVINKGKEGETYCVGGGAEKNGIEIANVILEKLGKPKELVTFVEDRSAHDRRYAIDNSKIKKELGWQPKHSFESGMQKTIDWYTENRGWIENIRARQRISG